MSLFTEKIWKANHCLHDRRNSRNFVKLGAWRVAKTRACLLQFSALKRMTCLFQWREVFIEHSWPQRLRSFWSAPRFATKVLSVKSIITFMKHGHNCDDDRLYFKTVARISITRCLMFSCMSWVLNETCQVKITWSLGRTYSRLSFPC